jgi:O-antigen/teichoic acid export membrane protein
MDFGAWSWILARLVMSISTCAWSWKLSHLRVGMTPQVRRWRYLIGSSLRLVATGIAMLLVFQAGSIVLGIVYDKTIVGRFYFAYNLSISLLIPITISVTQVLLPSISKLQDDIVRFRSAFLRSANVFSFVVAPLTLLVAATADPFVRLLFDEKWIPSIPTLQLLSLAVAFKCGELPAMNCLKAIGRFDRVLEFYCVNLLVTYTGVSIGAILGESIAPDQSSAAAMGLTVAWAIVGPLALAMALSSIGLPRRRFFSISLPPLVAGLVSMGSAMLIVNTAVAWPTAPGEFGAITYAVLLVVQMAAIAVIGLGLYGAFMWWVRRSVFLEVIGPVLAKVRASRARRSVKA